MKVLCVDKDAWPVGYPPDDNGGVIENGNTYEVIDVFFNDGYIWYCVSADGLSYGYWENCFARTSDIDELELSKEREVLLNV